MELFMAFNENAERDRERRSAEEVKRFPCLRRGVLYKPIEGINARRRGFKFHACSSRLLGFSVLIRRKRIPRRWGRVRAPLSCDAHWRESATMAKPTLYERSNGNRLVVLFSFTCVKRNTRNSEIIIDAHVRHFDGRISYLIV